MKKKLMKIFILSVCVIVLFSACGFNSGIAIGRVQSSSKTSWKQSHYMLEGMEIQTLSLGSEPIKMKIDVVTEEGRIDIYVNEKNGKEIIYIDDAETGTYEFTAEGKIKIKIEAKAHRGSFNIKKADS